MGVSLPLLPTTGAQLGTRRTTSVSKCINVQGGVFADGTPVQLYTCNGNPVQNWLLNRGSTKVQLSGTNFCLDAGSNPEAGNGYTDDNKIALEGKGQCLDLPNGNLSNSNRVQTWQCTDKNENQVWTL
ncbi:carbohydrate-binding module family 13 protein [Ephemerocybe angulata]|uniref:Carbohydrate-binding module family 13 protein n=1 Tax=Ephemerocybe angulata TaxID=980116 RepID=A0A8H6HPY1_9AGAR|nr:carbohydrate-binding module family 13 protein [Tulosesus angulatus]